MGLAFSLFSRFLFCPLFILIAPLNAHARDDVDRLVDELKAPGWRTSVSSPDWVSRYKDDGSFETLSSLISNKGIHWTVRIRAILLLGETQNPRGVALLTQTLTDPVINNDCPAIKWNTATALGNFGNDAVVLETLVHALRFEDNVVVREAVIDSLGKLGDAKAVAALVPLLSDRSFAIRFSTVKALGKIGDPAAASHLRHVSDNDSDPYIRNEAHAALKKLNGNG